MQKYIDTFCPFCDKEVHASLQDRDATCTVRGDNIEYTETIAICPDCHQIIGDVRVEAVNLERAYAIYRKNHGLKPDENICTIGHHIA